MGRRKRVHSQLAGCGDVTIHDLRRKRITDVTNAEGREAAQRLAAHADARTTANYYAAVPRVKI